MPRCGAQPVTVLRGFPWVCFVRQPGAAYSLTRRVGLKSPAGVRHSALVHTPGEPPYDASEPGAKWYRKSPGKMRRLGVQEMAPCV